MRKFNRAICFFLTFVLLVQQGLPVHAKGTGEERTEVETISRTYVNPVYEDVVEIEEDNRPVASRSTYAMPKSVKSSVEYVDQDDFLIDETEVAAAIREGMVKREEVITFYYKNKTGYNGEDLPNWFELALSETENSDEGDYLRWHWEQVSAEVSGYEEDGISYFEYIMYFTYYTTKEQEDELTERIDSVLDEIGADDPNLSDYEKTGLIYDYICDNVTYDEENLYDETHMLKFTAYAAMINKTAVCQGYASLIYRMLEECDVDARVVFGTSGNVNHTWTLSEINEVYYLSDATWDAGMEEYSYFLKGEDNFSGHNTESTFLSEYKIDDEDYDPLAIRVEKVSSFKATNSGSNVKLTWKESADADGYLIYRKKSGGDYSQIKRINSNKTVSYTDKNVSSGTKYAYYIVAYKTTEDGREGVSGKVSAQIVHVRVSVSNQNGSVKVKWSKVANAAGYKVYRKASGDDSYQGLKNIKSGTTTSYTDKTAKTLRNGRAASYIVIPYYSKDSSVVLKSGSKVNVYLDRTSISSLKAGSKALTVSWKKNSKATGYQIRYSTSSSMENAKSVTVKSVKTVSKKLSSLKAKKTYYVQVRSYKTYKDVNYYSTWSAKKSLKTK